MIKSAQIKELLRTKRDGRLFHREGQELEFKEQFNLAGLADYFRDFAAFANNRGGPLIFGVTDSPRRPVGLSATALEQFEKIDAERITGFLIETFSQQIGWEQGTFEINGATFGVFYVSPARDKPVIARCDEGKQQTIRNGDIYFRYAGRTQRIQFAELESLISHRIEQNNQHWMDLVKKIGTAGPQNAAILDTERSLLQKHEAQILVVDDALAKKLRFIKEGQFTEKKGTTALKLVGDVLPVETVEVVRRVRENLIREYPLSGAELAAAVKALYPRATTNGVWAAIRECKVKDNPDYAAYNFRNKKQEDEFKTTGKLNTNTPVIYNRKAAAFLAQVLKARAGDV